MTEETRDWIRRIIACIRRPGAQPDCPRCGAATAKPRPAWYAPGPLRGDDE